MGCLDGVRVVEIGGGVGLAYAAKLLADLGADVVRVEAEGDLVRARPFEAHRWLNTNKRSVSALGDLVDGAELLLHDLGPTAARGAGLDYAGLAPRHPALVVGSLTPYGMTGPWADWPGGELTVIHGSSWGYLSPSAATDLELPPLKAPGHHASILTATIAATAFLAALERAAQTGRGDHVDFSAFAAAAKLTETAPAGASFVGVDASRVGVKTLVPWGTYQLRDGLMQYICVEQTQWEALVELMGTPEWTQLGVFDSNDDRRQNADLVELYLSEWMAGQSVDELYRVGQARRLCMTPVYRMDQLSDDAQLAARGFFVEDPDGLRQPRAGYVIDQPWWDLRRRAPQAAEHDSEGWLDRPEGEAAGRGWVESGGGDRPARPLDGVRICDFSWIWAGPFCNQLLAHLGADVVRLESPEHLCLLRRLPFNPPDMPLTPDTTGSFQIYNTDKRSLCIDLRNEAAHEVVRRLVARSDVVIDNFAVGTMAKLGFGVEDLRAINPEVIVVSLSGYGQTGPAADNMAYGPAGGAFAGLYAANGYEGGRAAETGVAIGDPGTGLTAAFAAMVALAGRRRTGVAARVDVAMVEAIAATVGELWLEYLATGTSPAPRGNHDPQWAPHALYATGPDEWIAIACTEDSQWAALAALAAAQADGSIDARFAAGRFATAAGRKASEAELDALIGEWVAGQDRDALVRTLVTAGVPAMASLAPLELWSANEQLAALGMLDQPEHAVTGRHTVPGVPWRLENGPNGLRRAAPALGQHTDEVLAELGFDEAEVAVLKATGALAG
ncbi:MAG: CoA transferase [Acidimicrobiia bacterium]|nr:CoA transferase [Acidimicrobiia bacterium]